MTPIEEINHKGKGYEIKQDRQGRFYLYKIKYNKIYEDYIGSGDTIEECRSKVGCKGVSEIEYDDDKQLAFKL